MPANDFAALVRELEKAAYNHGYATAREEYPEVDQADADIARAALLAYGAGVEQALRRVDAACLKVCVDSTGTADDFGKESDEWRYLLIGEGDVEIIATDDPASVIESLGQMLDARDAKAFALGQQWVTKVTTADGDSPSVIGADLSPLPLATRPTEARDS